MKKWRASSRMACVLAAVLATGMATAQEASATFAPPNLTQSGVRALASGCAMCHGNDGHPVPGSVLAPLAGRRADALVEAMRAFREGKREATVMHQIARGYGDAEIAALAEYFSKRAP
jgi:cytochrome c553